MTEWVGRQRFPVDLENGFFPLPLVFHPEESDSSRDASATFPDESQGREVLGGAVLFSELRDTLGIGEGTSLTPSSIGEKTNEKSAANPNSQTLL